MSLLTGQTAVITGGAGEVRQVSRSMFGLEQMVRGKDFTTQRALGLQPARMDLVLPDFAYRAVAADGVVENEVCPVFVAHLDGDPELIHVLEADLHVLALPGLLRRSHLAAELEGKRFATRRRERVGPQGCRDDALEQPQDMQIKRSQMWHDWLRKRVADLTEDRGA